SSTPTGWTNACSSVWLSSPRKGDGSDAGEGLSVIKRSHASAGTLRRKSTKNPQLMRGRYHRLRGPRCPSAAAANHGAQGAPLASNRGAAAFGRPDRAFGADAVRSVGRTIVVGPGSLRGVAEVLAPQARHVVHRKPIVGSRAAQPHRVSVDLVRVAVV